MMRTLILTAIILFLTPGKETQDLKKLQGTFLEAEYFLMLEEYSDALPYYLQLYESLPGNANLAYRIGLCYLNIDGRKNMALNYLETAARSSSASYREGSINQKTAPYEAIFHLGEAYRINYRFEEAKEAFKRYKGTLLPGDIENNIYLDQQIRACDNAVELISSPIQYREENMGPLFNDEKSNFNPVISADNKTFAFMVGLKFYNAIMLTSYKNNKWQPPVNITPEVELEGTVFISCLTADGNTLLLSRNDNFESDIYSTTFNGTRWLPATRLNKNINTRYWESHGYITEDGNTLIFASDRPGGFGGLDLYVSKKTDGDWGPAVNMGPEINTPFNEDRPFLVNGGKTLFFCSQGHYSMGGYDIFRSEIQSNGLWSTPDNLGYPLNTPDDDTFFMPEIDGKGGYISKFKGTSDNYGKEDIYRITFK